MRCLSTASDTGLNIEARGAYTAATSGAHTEGASGAHTEGARGAHTDWGASGAYQVEDDGLLVEVVSRRVEQHAAVLEAREVVDQSLVHHKLKHTAKQIDILVTYMYSTSATQLQL